MRYGELRDQVLKLLNQYTVAGDPVAETYNNQADYLKRIPTFANDAIMEIATTTRKIPVTLPLYFLSKEEFGEYYRYRLPDDFYQFKSGDTLVTDEGRHLHTGRVEQNGKKYLLVAKDDVGKYTVTYYRYPNLLSDEPDDEDELDNAPETHYAVPFYVAGMLASHDNAFLCSLFMNKYADKLSTMTPGITADVMSTTDVYGFGGGFGYGFGGVY